MEAEERRLWEGLQRYADADRSDPFAFARGAAHIRMGLCGPCEKSDMSWAWRNERGKSTGCPLGEPGGPGHYDAQRIGLTSWGSIARL